MENKFTDINDLVLFLSGTAVQPLLTDEIWQKFGYEKRPKRGNIWSRLFPKIFELENLIKEEILTMVLIDTLNGIKKSSQSIDDKLLISIGVIDGFIAVTKHLFDSDLFMENLFSTYTSFVTYEKSKLPELFIVKAKNILSQKHFTRFLVGIIALIGMPPYIEDFLIRSEYIKDVVDNSSIENKLKINISEEMYKKYGQLVLEKILNI